MHSPESTQASAHLREGSGPLPIRTMSSTPAMAAAGSASAMPAGAVIGQASKHLPHLVQASSIVSTRAARAVSKGPAMQIAINVPCAKLIAETPFCNRQVPSDTSARPFERKASNETQYRSHPHDPRRQLDPAPATAGVSAGAAEEGRPKILQLRGPGSEEHTAELQSRE